MFIYGFSAHITTAGGGCGLYDTATLGAATATQGVFIDELYEATDEDTVNSDWVAPYVLQTDLTVVVSTADCIIYHDVVQ